MNSFKTKNNNGKIAVFGCKNTTLELIKRLHRKEIIIQYCITISPEKASDQKVAGYLDLKPFLKELNIPFYTVNKYNLQSEKDEIFLKSLNLDIILCIGWQRLIPEWLLNNLNIGAFGMHGSNKPLPHGRGRSPMNWSLIQNKEVFYTHLFQYLPGVDDGPIIDCIKFDINKWDDCNTLHYKNTIAMTKLCLKCLPELLTKSAKTTTQYKIEPSYFPKRTMDDGIIFWTDSIIDIYNLIRAVTKPFPGAFCFVNNEEKNKMIIWNAIPFDTRLEWSETCFGEVLEVFNDGLFLVQAGDGVILVKEYEYKNKEVVKEGLILGSGTYKPKNYELPR